MKNKKFLLIFVFLFVIIYIFAKNKDYININYSNGKKIYYLTGSKIICSPDSVINIKGNNIKITRGRIWVTTGKRTSLKIIQNNNNIEINGATIDLNATDDFLNVFNGNIYVFGKRISRGQGINLKNKKISFIKNLDEWQKQNIETEVSRVLMDIQGEKEIKELFEKKIDGLIKNNYWTMLDNEPIFRIKINFSDTENKVNGTVTHVPSGQIIGIIDEKIEEKNLNEINAINIGTRILDIINFYIENELYEGRIIIIETTDLNNEDLNEFRKLLSNISGCKILEEKNYYNIKNVFKIIYVGYGYDIAEIIKNNNAKIHIYNISINNLKIKGQN